MIKFNFGKPVQSVKEASRMICMRANALAGSVAVFSDSFQHELRDAISLLNGRAPALATVARRGIEVTQAGSEPDTSLASTNVFAPTLPRGGYGRPSFPAPRGPK